MNLTTTLQRICQKPFPPVSILKHSSMSILTQWIMMISDSRWWQHSRDRTMMDFPSNDYRYVRVCHLVLLLSISIFPCVRVEVESCPHKDWKKPNRCRDGNSTLETLQHAKPVEMVTWEWCHWNIPFGVTLIKTKRLPTLLSTLLAGVYLITEEEYDELLHNIL